MDQKDLEYLRKIKSNIDFINEHMNGVTKKHLTHNPVLLDSMMLRITLIAEDSKYLSDYFIEEHHEIPWILIRGLRNRIIHDYGGVDLSIIYDTLVYDIPILGEKIQSIL